MDRETKVTHDMLAAQIEARLGSGEGSAAKGPDMKVWDNYKGDKLSDVRHIDTVCIIYTNSPIE